MSAFFSRTGISSPFGKLVSRMPAFNLPLATYEALRAQAAEGGMGLIEYVREVLTVRAHGEEVVRSVHVNRISVAAGKRTE